MEEIFFIATKMRGDSETKEGHIIEDVEITEREFNELKEKKGGDRMPKQICDLCGKNFGCMDRYGVVDEQEDRTVKTICEDCVENIFELNVYPKSTLK